MPTSMNAPYATPTSGYASLHATSTPGYTSDKPYEQIAATQIGGHDWYKPTSMNGPYETPTSGYISESPYERIAAGQVRGDEWVGSTSMSNPLETSTAGFLQSTIGNDVPENLEETSKLNSEWNTEETTRLISPTDPPRGLAWSGTARPTGVGRSDPTCQHQLENPKHEDQQRSEAIEQAVTNVENRPRSPISKPLCSPSVSSTGITPCPSTKHNSLNTSSSLHEPHAASNMPHYSNSLNYWKSWRRSEDERLSELVRAQTDGTLNWDVVAFGVGRTAGACRARWYYTLSKIHPELQRRKGGK